MIKWRKGEREKVMEKRRRIWKISPSEKLERAKSIQPEIKKMLEDSETEEKIK